MPKKGRPRLTRPKGYATKKHAKKVAQPTQDTADVSPSASTVRSETTPSVPPSFNVDDGVGPSRRRSITPDTSATVPDDVPRTKRRRTDDMESGNLSVTTTLDYATDPKITASVTAIQDDGNEPNSVNIVISTPLETAVPLDAPLLSLPFADDQASQSPVMATATTVHRTNDVPQPPSPPKPLLITTTHIENDIALSDVREICSVQEQSPQPSQRSLYVRDTTSNTPADRRLIRRASLDDSSDEEDQPLPQRVVVTAAMVHHREPNDAATPPPAPQLFATQLDNNDVVDRHTLNTQEIQRLVSQVNWDDVEIACASNQKRKRYYKTESTAAKLQKQRSESIYEELARKKLEFLDFQKQLLKEEAERKEQRLAEKHELEVYTWFVEPALKRNRKEEGGGGCWLYIETEQRIAWKTSLQNAEPSVENLDEASVVKRQRQSGKDYEIHFGGNIRKLLNTNQVRQEEEKVVLHGLTSRALLPTPPNELLQSEIHCHKPNSRNLRAKNSNPDLQNEQMISRADCYNWKKKS
ncbi:hypothetical protein NQ318_009148 [Aromia moschata]|uniref:Uncharacterized protein n=1 Tax=Aromia moschata TaxID=1265417 RepID=A0AAV8XGG7_9CUCU|nr:hypothetical protein NQ318_009148 [Aromia moschata]